MIDVKDLLAESGPSKVIYIFGYKSKKLIQVKVVWGKLAQKKPNIETIVSIATQLSNYFRFIEKPEDPDVFKIKDGDF